MRSWKIALAFIRVPRLFGSLLLFPLLVGIIFAYVQLLVTGLFVKAVNRDSAQFEASLKKRHESNLLLTLLFGEDSDEIETKVCRWSERDTPKGVVELPPDIDCNPGSFEISLQVPHPDTFDPSPYLEAYGGLVPRIHVCKSCRTDITIHIDPDAGISTTLGNVVSVGVISLAETLNGSMNEDRLASMRKLENLKRLRGKTFFNLKGFREPISYSGYRTTLALVFNAACLILIALFLALKAHRKVLEYFSKNGALLPLVAACGKESFYRALWLITSFRVGAFLIASVPVSWITFSDLLDDEQLRIFVGDSLSFLPLWILALASSLAAVTVVASIADLKQRHGIMNILYRYIPLAISFFGAALWALTLLGTDQGLVNLLRSAITAIPVVGLGPLILGPMFKPSGAVLLAHTGAAALLLYYSLLRNSRWFAAHLEEV